MAVDQRSEIPPAGIGANKFEKFSSGRWLYINANVLVVNIKSLARNFSNQQLTGV
jgi:hypothetical protein